MRRIWIATLVFASLVSFAFSQESSSGQKSSSSPKSELERAAITNLRKFSLGEQNYAMSHPSAGFACHPEVLTQLTWQNSEAKLLEPALLSGTGNYRFSASCPQDSESGSKLNVFAVPLDPHANLRTFCITVTFGPYETEPYVATGESSIRGIFAGNAASCLVSGEPLK
jgi:hypothetical protein